MTPLSTLELFGLNLGKTQDHCGLHDKLNKSRSQKQSNSQQRLWILS